MKFLHSPSSSSSSTAEFRPNYTTTGCISAILRRLPCFNNTHLPNFSLDNQINRSYGKDEFDELCCGNKLKGTPGIVAKLMGLDSMPVANPIGEWRQLTMERKGNYVLEAPTFVELENEKFIILSFEGDGKDKELKVHSAKTRKGLIQSKKIYNCQSPEDSDEVMNSGKLSILGKNCEKFGEKECAKRVVSRKKEIQNTETDSDSDNSSPVSVLEFQDHHEASCSGKEELKSKNSNSRRKLRGDLDKKSPSPPSSPRSSCSSVDDGEESSRTGKEYIGLENKKFLIGDSKEIWEEICKMAERDVMDSSRVKMERWKGEDIEEIGVCFELQILDQLILELFTMT